MNCLNHRHRRLCWMFLQQRYLNLLFLQRRRRQNRLNFVH
jgi:hypothetical protein